MSQVRSELELSADEREAHGQHMHAFVSQLFPICRSITGDGLRETLRRIGDQIPLEIHEVPTGTQVLDWTVPKEWNITDAAVTDARGERVIDFKRSNLHVVNYSVPFEGRMTLDELRPHLHTLPDRPDWIPYRTSYYREDWGFCLAHHDLEALGTGPFDVRIDSSLRDGSLSYGECLLPGETANEVLISTHVCHPSLANDNLSGLAVATFLAQSLADRELRYSYRFLFVPGTIGSIAWLARNEEKVARIRHGLVIACVGDSGPFTFKRTRRGSTEIDRTMEVVLAHLAAPYEIVDFSPWGYDERQYGSPGFDLPVGLLTRSSPGSFPEYHTSGDDLAFVGGEALAESLELLSSIVETLEANRIYRNLSPKGEPQLGRRGLYPSLGGGDAAREQMAMLWVLNRSDGMDSLLEIAERSGMALAELRRAAGRLVDHGLLEEVGGPISAEHS